ncbi:MAG: TIGR00730 family Rossman fold protein [Verrucomicrobiota bacterium]
MKLKTICVYCGSRMGTNPRYQKTAKILGEELVRRGYGLVYGGGDIGLMGTIAHSVMDAGGEVTGVIPKVLLHQELGLKEVTELLVVESMHERKTIMAERADGFIAMPGGIGTLEELFEIITWGYLGLHQKPCGLLNVAGYYNDMLKFLEHAESESFMHQALERYLVHDGEPAVLLDQMETMTLPEVATIIEKVDQT